MFKVIIVVFRECVEIALLLGIILALTKKIENSRICIIAGVMLGIIGASLFAFFAKSVSLSFSGMGDEIFDSIIIIVTVLLIWWTLVWMKGYNYRLQQKISNIATSSSASILVLVVASTILREGTEIILLIYGISSAESMDINNYLIGFGIGALSGLLFGIIIYLGLVKFAGRYIFKISSLLLTLVAGGLASQAAAKLTSTTLINSFTNQLWDSSWLVSDFSTMGKILNAITGYTARPNGMQLIFYFITISAILLSMKFINNHKISTQTLSVTQND